MINGFHVNDRRVKIDGMIKKARAGKAKVWARNYVIDLLAHERYQEAALCAYNCGLVKEIQKKYLERMGLAMQDDRVFANYSARMAILRELGRAAEAEQLQKQVDDFETLLYR